MRESYQSASFTNESRPQLANHQSDWLRTEPLEKTDRALVSQDVEDSFMPRFMPEFLTNHARGPKHQIDETEWVF
jgi:hypothetical protein